MVGMRDEIIKRDPFPDTSKVITAVVTGEHPFNVPGFHNLFRSLAEIDAYPQHMESRGSERWMNGVGVTRTLRGSAYPQVPVPGRSASAPARCCRWESAAVRRRYLSGGYP